jgi:hypothetical protein
MKDYGDVLDTRSGGAQTRWEIERAIASSGEGDALVLDFEGVRAITVPFAEECIGWLLAGRTMSHYDNHPVLAVNANEDVRRTLTVTLANQRLALLHATEPPELLGGDEVLNNTLAIAWKLQRFSASQIASRLAVTPQAANNRLKALVSRGALTRTLVIPPGGGKEFVYSVPDGSSFRVGDIAQRGSTASPASVPVSS